MEVIPSSIQFAVGKLENYNVNNFKVMPNGSTTAGPDQRVQFSLPSSSTLLLDTFNIHMDVLTTSVTSATNAIRGKLPSDSASLIAQMTVSCNGVPISQSFSEFNTASKIKKLTHSDRNRDGSVDNVLSHGTMTTGDAVDDVSLIFRPSIGFFSENSTNAFPSGIAGDLVVEIVFAPASVLGYKEHGRAMNLDFSNGAHRTAATAVTYSVSNLYATIDTVDFGPGYQQLLATQLTSSEEGLKCRFKEFYSYSLKSTTGDAHDVRFALSCASLDAIYVVMRDANYEQNGIRTRQCAGVSLSDANVANAFKFKSFNSSTTKAGTLKYQFDVNSIKKPMHEATILDAACELVKINEGYHHKGMMASSLQDYNDSKAVFPLCLNYPGAGGVAVQSGFSSRGSQSQMTFSIKGLTLPTADADSQTTAALSTYVLCETTATLVINAMRSVVPQY